MRLDPNLSARVGAHEPLLAYFEVYHLRSDAAGATRFEYETTVRPLRADSRPWFRRLFAKSGPDAISVRSSEEGIGPTRRQYLTVPVQPLPPGAYRLEISVSDRVSGKRSRRSTGFVKPAPATTD